jgi:hypothetical protein
LHCIVPGGGGQRGQWKNSRSNGISVKALSKVLERSFAKKLKAKRAYKIRANKTRFMEETLGGLPRNHWKHKVCGGIFG